MTEDRHNNGTGEFLCGAESKRMFTHDRASRFAREMRRKKNSNHAPYRCRSCGFFHIGSSDSRRQHRRRRTRDARRPSGGAR